LAFDDFGGDLDQTVRELRCSDSVRCPHCDSRQVTKRGFDDTQKEHSDFLKMIADLRICGLPAWVSAVSAMSKTPVRS
jgi:hypothetical protein